MPEKRGLELRDVPILDRASNEILTLIQNISTESHKRNNDSINLFLIRIIRPLKFVDSESEVSQIQGRAA